MLSVLRPYLMRPNTKAGPLQHGWKLVMGINEPRELCGSRNEGDGRKCPRSSNQLQFPCSSFTIPCLFLTF
jgi:hypothetical protein